jgi:hypothetical protein
MRFPALAIMLGEVLVYVIASAAMLGIYGLVVRRAARAGGGAVEQGA